MKLIIAGSRGFNNQTRAVKMLDVLLEKYPDMTVISGMARGADLIGYNWACSRNLTVLKYKPEWEKYGRSAGHIRNEEMAKVGTHLLAFWDGKSPGTASMIRYAEQYGLKIHVVKA